MSESSKQITVVLADDHKVVREGLGALLGTEPDFRVIGETGDGLEAVRLVKRLRPDVLILDLTMPGLAAWRSPIKSGSNYPRPAS